MQKRTFIVIAATILLLFGILFFTHKPNVEQNPLENSNIEEQDSLENSNVEKDSQQRPQNEQSESCSRPVFTAYFVDPSYVQKVGQVGVVHGSGLYIVERSYVSVRNEFTGQKIPVYAPVDMTIRTGSHYYNPALIQGEGLPDYALWFDAGCGVEVNIAHLKEVVDSLASELGAPKTDSRSMPLQSKEFKAGDLIGYFIYNEGDVAGFDFIVRDKKVTNQFINQERYSGNRASNLINGACPYDYYEPVKKQEYYNLLGGGGGTVFNVKDCGKVSRDVPGSVSGMWFLDKEPQESIYEGYKDGDYGSTLSIVGDEERVTIGNLGSKATSLVYHNNPTYKLPEDITSEYCYQFDGFNPGQDAGWVYLKPIDERTMDVYYSPSGSCPNSMPSGAKRYWK